MRYWLLLAAALASGGCQTLLPRVDKPEAPPSPSQTGSVEPAPTPPVPPPVTAGPDDVVVAAEPPAAAPPVDPPQPTPEPAAGKEPVTDTPTVTAVPQAVEVRTPPLLMEWLRPVNWKDLPGWKTDELKAAWPAWLQSCSVLRRQSAWRANCAWSAKLKQPDNEQIREFFQTRFKPYQVQQAEGGVDGLVTGYYEPLLRGSKRPTERFRYPLRTPPDDMLVVELASVYPELKGMRLRGRLDGNRVVPYFTRGEIEAGKPAIQGREFAWVDDAVELFFLQVQGSGRIQMDNGELMRIGYADQNGHPYRSIGKWLVEQGELTLGKASMQGIKDWARTHPTRLQEMLAVNPSYVFFRELPDHEGGPLGALGVPLTAERSIAVDPTAIPLGAPVWLASTRPSIREDLQRLVMAQDTGSAIKGNVRADYFWGFGDEAGKLAGAMKQKGRMWLLLPNDYPIVKASRGNPGRNGL